MYKLRILIVYNFLMLVKLLKTKFHNCFIKDNNVDYVDEENNLKK